MADQCSCGLTQPLLINIHYNVNGGISLIGRAPDRESGRCRFKSDISPQQTMLRWISGEIPSPSNWRDGFDSRTQHQIKCPMLGST